MPDRDEPELLELARRMTVLGTERTEQSSERSYQNAERNLAVVVHAAVAIMILGFAIDRYHINPNHASRLSIFHGHFITGTLTSWSAAGLIGLGVLMTFASGLRYLAFVIEYRRRHVWLLRYWPLLAPVLALLVAGFGLAMLALLFIVGR